MDHQLNDRAAGKTHRLGLWAATCAAVVAVACGGGGSSGGTAGVGSGGTGFVTGFGSVIVDGVTYEDSALDSAGAVKIEDRTGDADATRSVIRIGQRLELALSDDGRSVRSAVVASELTGPVTQVAAVGETSFRVVNQLVVINTDTAVGPLTVFEGASALSDFAAGDRVEVHGDVRADGSILASRIERKPNVDANGQPIALVKVSGFVSALTGDASTTRTFTVGGVNVSFASGQPVTPVGATLSNGQRVKVFGTFANNAVTANAVRIKRFNQALGDFRLRGVVSSIASQTEFVINGITVDASAIANADRPVITVNRAYRIRGAFTPAAAGSTSGGSLKATEIKDSNDDGVKSSELKGSITDFVSAANFRVRGVLVDSNGVVPTPANCTLGNGQFVEVKGAVNRPDQMTNGETKVVATRIECKSTPATGSELKLTRAVEALNTGNKTFNLGTQAVAYSTATEFEDGVVGDLANGAVVEVEGRLSNGVLNARKIEFKSATPSNRDDSNDDGDDDSDANSEDREVEGTLAQDASSTGGQVSFTVNSVTLRCADGSFGGLCSTAQLRKGVKVEARYRNTGGVNAVNQVTRLKRERD